MLARGELRFPKSGDVIVSVGVVGIEPQELFWYPRPELNRDQRFRKPLLYPFELRGPPAGRLTFPPGLTSGAQTAQPRRKKPRCLSLIGRPSFSITASMSSQTLRFSLMAWLRSR